MPCSVTLAKYEIGECFSSRGGIKAVWVGVYEDNAYTVNASGDVTGFSSGITNMYKQELRRNIGSMTSTYNYDETAGSTFIQTDLVFQYGKMDFEKRLQMNALSKGDLIVVVEDSNGVYYALGVEEPVHASAGTGSTGAARTDSNNYEITLSDFSSEYPPILNPSAVEALLAFPDAE